MSMAPLLPLTSALCQIPIVRSVLWDSETRWIRGFVTASESGLLWVKDFSVCPSAVEPPHVPWGTGVWKEWGWICQTWNEQHANSMQSILQVGTGNFWFNSLGNKHMAVSTMTSFSPPPSPPALLPYTPSPSPFHPLKLSPHESTAKNTRYHIFSILVSLCSQHRAL